MMRKRIFASLIFVALILCAPVMAQKSQTPKVPPRGKPASFYLAKGGRLLETGDYQQAIVYLDAALHAPRKGVKPAIFQLAEVLRKSAQFYQEARVEREAGRGEAAVEKYQQIININPTDPKPVEFIVEVYDLLSEAAEKRNDYQEAARLYECWRRYAPQNDFPLKGEIKNLKAAAQAADARGDHGASILFYKKLIEVDPNDQAAQACLRELERQQSVNAISAQLQRKEFGAAITAINSALFNYPNDPQLTEQLRLARGGNELNQADELMQTRNYHEAFNHYQRSLAFLPEEKDSVDEKIAQIKLRTGADYQSDGALRARGAITGPAKIKIAGKTVTYLEGKSNLTLSVFASTLPARLFDAKVERTDGDAAIKIIELPNRANGYAITLQIIPKNDRNIAFDLNWELLTTGTVDWRGQINGTTVIHLQGPFVDSTGAAHQVASTQDPLPHEAYSVAITKVRGSDAVNAHLIERPTAANDYSAAIEVTAPGAQAEVVELKIDWMITRNKKSRFHLLP